MPTPETTPHRKTIDYEKDEAVPVEISVPGDVLLALIDMAREYQAKVEVVEPDPGSNASDDKMAGVLEDYGDDAVELEFRQIVADFNEDQKADVVALMWLGRGDFDTSDWNLWRRAARSLDRPDVGLYLLRTPLVADYLNEGLAALHRSVLDENPPAPL